jgi:o-succinylbenzoate synthase
MKLADLAWMPYRVPFRAAFRTAHGSLGQRTGAIVTATTDDGIAGIGEIAPLPGQSGLSLYAVLRTLVLLARDLKGRELADILRFLRTQSEEERLPSSLVCGLEIALFDALGRARGQSMAALLASGYPGEEQREPVPPRARVPVNAVIGGTTIKQAVEQAREAVSAGFTCLKLKVTGMPDTVIDCVAKIRSAIGPEINLRLDANEGWDPDLTKALFILGKCEPYAIQYVEQPLPARSVESMARLRRFSPISIAADEALVSLASARRVLEAGAADVFILKPQLLGGLQVCRKIVQEADQRGVACVLTSNLEAGIGVAATLHLAAALPRITLPCGLATLDLLENDLLLAGPVIEQGYMAVPAGPGLGVELNRDALLRDFRGSDAKENIS